MLAEEGTDPISQEVMRSFDEAARIASAGEELAVLADVERFRQATWCLTPPCHPKGFPLTHPG